MSEDAAPRNRADDALVADYLLGELAPARRAEFERRLAGDHALRERVEALAATVARLDQVPGEAWDAVAGDGAAAGEPAAREPAANAPAGAAATDAPAPGVAPPPRRRLRLPSLALAGPRAWGLATAASIALLALGVAIGVLVERDGDEPVTGPTVVLAPLDSSPAPARAEARMVGPDRMRLAVEDLRPSPPGTYYEAWLLNDADDLVPVASFRVGDDGRAVVVVPLPAAADRYRYLDVSLQRVGEGTEHSADSVLRGALS